MGIRGLMTYINNNPHFVEDYELHNCYVVIDGLALAAHLFFSSKCNCSFGGDYDKYSNYVSSFFDGLRKCEITPLVILDGASETKKLATISDRQECHLKLLLNYTPASEATTKIGPANIERAFVSVLKQKGVKVVRALWEADPSIAAVAKTLGCAVLSRDSDFYVFGVNYISTDSLFPIITKNSWGRGFVLRCQIFRPQYLLRSFRGLDLSVLPLAATLLGNDYVKSEIFKDFFATLKLSDQSKKLRNLEQRRIDATLRWLRDYNLNDAVVEILSKVPKKKRREVLNAIEITIDGYENLPCDILLPLGLTKEYEAEMKAKSERKAFKFQRDINTLKSTLSWRSGPAVVTSEDSSSEDETKEESSITTSNLFNYSEECSEEFVSSWPPWFAHHYKIADFPMSFMGMMFRRVYSVPVQMEDFNYPSSHEMSLKIVGVIDGLLVAGRKESALGLLHIIREGTKFVERRVDTVRGTRSTIFPALCDLRDTSMSIREQIFYDALEIMSCNETLINDIPSQWRLYIVTAVYWMRQAGEPSPNWLHMQALLFTMLLDVLDKTIVHCRDLWWFNKQYGETLSEIESKPKSAQTVISEEKNGSILDALKAVTKNDCLLAARFFMSRCMMNPQLCECPEEFNVTIVHVFAQFQSCLMGAVTLKSLLGLSYETPLIGELYNGTMLYNLYTAFEKSSNVDSYIKTILEKSPSLLHLLNRLTATVKEMLSAAPVEDKMGEASA